MPVIWLFGRRWVKPAPAAITRAPAPAGD